jgi:hypothetical protein
MNGVVVGLVALVVGGLLARSSVRSAKVDDRPLLDLKSPFGLLPLAWFFTAGLGAVVLLASLVALLFA